MGINQHHDGISGTATQHAADDYAFRLHNSMVDSRNTSAKVIDEQLSFYTGINASNW